MKSGGRGEYQAKESEGFNGSGVLLCQEPSSKLLAGFKTVLAGTMPEAKSLKSDLNDSSE